MRIMPFMKRKKGVQFAGIGLDTGGGGGGSLPIASADTLGAVKIGENLSITSEGLLSAEGGSGEPNFSTTEINTGTKWVDGSDIYRITGVRNDASGNSEYTISIASLNVKNLIKYFSIKYRTSEQLGADRIEFYPSRNELYIKFNRSGDGDVYYTIYYTKN